ncbi:MAG: nuclear transport factor 2 family protein [Microbacteriaceae bacterium]
MSIVKFSTNYLGELEELKQLKARYFRFIDTKDFERLPEVFTEDYVYADDAKERIIEGRDAFVNFIVGRHTDSVSVHQGYMPELEILSESEARGVWAMSDVVILPNTRNGRLIQRGNGHYHERYRKQDGVWRIEYTHLTRVWLSIEEQFEEFPNVLSK